MDNTIHYTPFNPSNRKIDASSTLARRINTEPSKVAPVQTEPKTKSQSDNNLSFQTISLNFGAKTGVLLGTAQIFVIGSDERKIKARALIDNCSQPSFISQKLVEKLNLLSIATCSPSKTIGCIEAVVGKQITELKVGFYRFWHFFQGIFNHSEKMLIAQIFYTVKY